MSEYRKSEITSGLFVSLAIAVFILFAFKVGGLDLFGFFRGETVLCRTYFTDVKTLRPGAEVRVGGQPVGKVLRVAMVERELSERQAGLLRDFFDDKRLGGVQQGMVRPLIEVEFELSDLDLRIHPRSATLTLSQGSLLAPHFLSLDPGEWPLGEAPPAVRELKSQGGVGIEARENAGFEELVAIAKPVVREMDATLKAINQRLLTTENTRAVSSILERLDRTVEAAAELMARLDSLFDRGKDPRLQETLDAVAQATAGLKGRLDEMQAEVRELLGGASGVISDNRAEIAEIARRLRRSVWYAELALRRVQANPSVLIFGKDQPDLESPEVDESAIRIGGRAPPYRQRDERSEPR